MKTMSVIMLLFLASLSMAGQYEWVDFYTGGLAEGTYIWTWGFAEEPKPVEGAGFAPGTAAVEVKWGKSADFTDWSSYGVYFGDIGFDMYDIVPDSVYFKLKAPDGVGPSDRLRVWLYDPRNSDWNNALYYELENFQILQDKEWHQFSVNLWDFMVNIGDIDPANVIAVSFERPAEDEDTAFPLMYIDDVWVGLPDFVSVEEKTPAAVNSFALAQNYPNPFNPATTITFELGKTTMATLSIFNLRGEKVAELVSEQLQTGSHSYQWNAGDMPSGTYFYQLKTEDFVQTRKMLLVQ
jgi:hypothetical protein